MHDTLEQLVSRSASALGALNESAAAQVVATGGWNRKQVLGHLIDSAANNHQRFVRASLQDEYRGPQYDQEGWVAANRHAGQPWADLIDFWSAYNRLLVRVIEGIPEAKLGVVCYVGDYEPMTLRELIADYIRHMEHHLGQLLGSAATR